MTAETLTLLRPGQERYDEARTLWNGMIDKQPAAIARAETVADAVQAVAFAREHGLKATVRGGGHGVAGNALNTGGLVTTSRR